MLKLFKLHSRLKILIVGLILIFILCGAKGCCTISPSAVLFGAPPDYKWVYRLSTYNGPIQSDTSDMLNELVSGFGHMQEYSFKVGLAQDVNCSDPTGYSEWTPRAQNLVADLTDIENNTFKLCIIGRGVDPCEQSKTQKYERATVYTWNLSRPLGTWSLTAPIGVINTLSTTATWSESLHATSYRIFVSDSASCNNSLGEAGNYSENSATITTSSEGDYYLCGEARDNLGNIKLPSNNGVKFKIFSNTEEIVLRNTISLGTGSTNMNVPIGNHSNQGLTPWYQLAIVKVTPQKRLLLSNWSAHMDGSIPSINGYQCGPDLNGFTVNMRIWSSLENAQNNPLSGDLANLDLTLSSPSIRELSGGLSLTGCPIEHLEYNLSSHAFILEANTDYYLAMDFSSISGIGGVWGIMESDEASNPDWIIYDDLDQNKVLEVISNTTFTESVSGGLGIKIRGWSVP